MKQYQNLLRKIMNEGVDRGDRTGTGTRSIFGTQMRFDLQDGFPALTTKSIHMKSVIHELLWFLSGFYNTRYLNENGVTIWDEWADENGDLGPVYGVQWRSWLDNDGRTIDQIQRVVDDLKRNPDSRRHIVSAWNVGELEDMALPPCHLLFQFYSRPSNDMDRQKYSIMKGKETEGNTTIYECPDRVLSCHMYQRSVDSFLGLPFNIASYSLLTHMVAQVTDHMPGEFIWSGGDTHIYSNHFKQVEEILGREPGVLSTLKMNPNVQNIDDFEYEDFELLNYNPQSKISAPIAV